MDHGPDIIIRNDHGAVAGRISRGPDGHLVVEVHDEESRWLVELAAARAGAPHGPGPGHRAARRMTGLRVTGSWGDALTLT